MGRGIEKICEACKKHGVPMPEYTLHLEDIMVKFTPLAYQDVLKDQYVLHTVGPIVSGHLTDKHCRQLADCYKSCLELAADSGLKSIVFCCISTGEFHFPQKKIAEIAVQTVKEYLNTDTCVEKVVFNVFKQEDYDIYRELLGSHKVFP